MAKNIDTKLKNIQNLFLNGQENILGQVGKFIIPDYQRAYNWKTNEQCDKLWQDIESFIDTKQNETYFLGSIIINNEDEKLYLIDGQQRVTTLFLLLKALLLKIDSVLLHFSDDDESKQLKVGLESRRKSIIQCLYAIDEDDVYLVTEGQKDYSNLEIKYINQSINEEYKDELPIILHGTNDIEIEKKVTKIPYKQKNNKYTNFYKNFLYFKEKFDNMGNDKLNKFAKDLLNSCQVIVVISYQTEESIEIFNSLNSTGMPLADADIISAKLYANYGSDNISNFKNDWYDIINRVNVLSSRKIVNMDDILNQYMYLQKALKGEKETTLPSVRRYFLDINKKLLNSPKDFINDLKTIISFWEEQSFDNLEESQIEELKNIYNIRSILLKNNSNFKFYYSTYFYCNKDKTLTEKRQYAENLLKLFALLTITDTSYSSSKFKQFLIDLNKQIAFDKISNAKINELFKNHISSNFDKNEIEKILKNDLCDAGIIFLNDYLYAKENSLKINLLLDNIQIEHIMPASGKNLIAIRTDAQMDEETFKQNVDRIGNKILLEQNINGSISNDWFRVKKQTSVKDKMGYRDSSFPIAQSLTSYNKDVWTKEDIDNASQKATTRILNFIFD